MIESLIAVVLKNKTIIVGNLDKELSNSNKSLIKGVTLDGVKGEDLPPIKFFTAGLDGKNVQILEEGISILIPIRNILILSDVIACSEGES